MTNEETTLLIATLKTIRATATHYAKGRIMDDVGAELARSILELTDGVQPILYSVKAETINKD